jgi:DNA-binding Lrp family transcriptional regulator
VRPQPSWDTAELDDLDWKIIQALQIEPRLAFSRAGEILGVSEQTIARRYRRLRADGLLRVIGLVDPRHIGQSEWMVRVGCRPGGAGTLAAALARREDVSWVTLSAGGSEIVCAVRSRTDQQRDDLLLQRLPATSQVLSMSAHAVLHRYVGGASSDWDGYGGRLSGDQIGMLRQDLPAVARPHSAARRGSAAQPGNEVRPDGAFERRETARLEAEDGPLLDELARDGRASYAALAGVTGWTQGRATRRLAALQRAGVVYFDVDLATQLMGFGMSAYLFLTVEPAALAAVGAELARHPEVPFAAAITGSANLYCTVVCRDTEELYRYVTTRISVVSGVRQLEISPVLRRVKQAGTRMDGPRLAVPSPPARRQPARPRPAAG